MASIRRLDTNPASADTAEFTFRLQNEKFYLPDIYKDYQRMLGKYQQMMCECIQPWCLVADNKLGGVFFTSDVVPGHEAVFYIWIWAKGCYTATTKEFINGYIEHCAENYGLDRIVCRTPDDKGLGRLLERLGFKLEGRFRAGYKHGGKLYTLYQFRRLF
jgi:RimJ/RimL family protein N-acetyltransferase